jgi:leader peptidase (prepilin peptidase) / N-methyltransferase
LIHWSYDPVEAGFGLPEQNPPESCYASQDAARCRCKKGRFRVTFFYIVIALFGLIFGSFLNVCIARLPRGESVVLPRSHCPRCNQAIRWYDNIPLLSYLILGAKCRDCRAQISPIYPFIEALTSLILCLTFYVYGLGPEFVKFALFGMLLIVLTFTDLFDRRIPHRVTIFGIGMGLLLSFFIPVNDQPLDWILRHWAIFLDETLASVIGAMAGALVGGGLFYAVGEIFYHAGGKQKEYLGFGDVMLMLMVGAFLGVPLTLLTILLGSLGGSIIAVAATVLSRRFRGYAWPYGTFLGIAAIYAGLNGERLLEWYLRISGIAR